MNQNEISKNTVISTATYYPENSGINAGRAKKAIDFVRTAIGFGYEVVIVDGGSFSEFKIEIEGLGARVYPETKETRGIGPSRRYSFQKACDLLKPVVACCEPEKEPIIHELPKLVAPILECKADLTIPNRGPLDSYPTSQQHEENFGNAFMKDLIGEFFDWWSGPRIGTRKIFEEYFIRYDGRKIAFNDCYGLTRPFLDKWDAIFCPALKAFSDGRKILSVDVDYIHPKEQTQAEEGNVEMTMFRRKQSTLVDMCYWYWKEILGHKNWTE